MNYWIISSTLPFGHSALTVNDRITLLDTVPPDYSVKIDILCKAEGDLLVPDWQSPTIPIISKTAADAIKTLKAPNTQVLTAHSDNDDLNGHDLYVIHSTNAVDAIDYEKSDLDAEDADDLIMTIDRLVLDTAKLEELDEQTTSLFFLPNKPSIFIVNETSLNLLSSLKLSGIDFIKPEEFTLEF